MYVYYLYNLLILFIVIKYIISSNAKILVSKKETKKETKPCWSHPTHLLYSNKERCWLFCLFSSKSDYKEGSFSALVISSYKFYKIIIWNCGKRILDKSQNFV